MTDPLFDRWAAEGAGARFTGADDLVCKHTEFERRIRRRNLIEYAAGGFVVLVFAWLAWHTARAGEVVVTLGWLLSIAGTAVVLANLYHRASNLPHRPEIDCRSHLRAQLEHQRQALASVPRWYLAPLVPGVALVLVGSVLPLARDLGWSLALAGIAIPAVIVGGIFGGIAWLNRRAARLLGKEIAELDALG